MPNRILKESICRSEDIEELSPMEEITFYRLIVSCDDFGRFDARPKIVKGHCFPLKNISDKEIRDILKRLASAGLLILYEADGKPILQMVSWNKHQTARAHNSKYPEYDSSCMHLYSDDFMCEQMKSNKNRKPQMNVEVKAPVQEEKESLKQPAEPPVITLQLNTGEEWPILKRDIEEWSALYPAIDVMQCLRNMRGWLSANPEKRKTQRGIKRFITNWLQKEQDKGGNKNYSSQSYYSQSQSYGNRIEQLVAENRGDIQ